MVSVWGVWGDAGGSDAVMHGARGVVVTIPFPAQSCRILGARTLTDSLDSLGSRDSTTQKSVNEDKKSRTAVSQVKRESENYASPRPIENEHIICYAYAY